MKGRDEVGWTTVTNWKEAALNTRKYLALGWNFQKWINPAEREMVLSLFGARLFFFFVSVMALLFIVLYVWNKQKAEGERFWEAVNLTAVRTVH